MDDLTLEFLELAKQYPGETDLKNVRSHCHKFLYTGLKVHTDLRDRLSEAPSLEEVVAVALEMKERRLNLTPEEKIGWYYRYWNSMNIKRGETVPYTMGDWSKKIGRAHV